jgi:hypothetical protein
LGNSKIDKIIINSSNHFLFNKEAKQHINLFIEEYVREIVSKCEELAKIHNYRKKHIGIGITKQVINTQESIQNTGDTQERKIGEKDENPEPEVA